MSKRIFTLALLGLAVCATAATADPAPKAEDPTPVSPAGGTGLVAVTDAAGSGVIGATTADLAAITAANPIPVRNDAAVAVTVRPDGTRSALLDDSFLATSVVRIGPDGKPIVGCVTSREEYDAFFAADAPAPVPAAEVR